jgi:hypothetical protein
MASSVPEWVSACETTGYRAVGNIRAEPCRTKSASNQHFGAMARQNAWILNGEVGCGLFAEFSLLNFESDL